jgi:hypothetical protein
MRYPSLGENSRNYFFHKTQNDGIRESPSTKPRKKLGNNGALFAFLNHVVRDKWSRVETTVDGETRR